MPPPQHSPESSVIETFATACEQINAYAGSLRSGAVFSNVRTGADIRLYKTGWRLEKWMEAELNPKEGWWAAWWIELGETDGLWRIETHLSISHSEFFLGLQELSVPEDQVHRQILLCVNELINALECNLDFLTAVNQHKK